MRSVALLALILLAGCPTRDISGVDNGHEGEVLNTIAITQNRDVDILFLIDNSSSMNDKQDLVAANFPNFIHVLQGIQGGLPNIHLGVTSSSASIAPYVANHCGTPENGLLQNTPRTDGCPVPDDNARFISDVQQSDGSRKLNYHGDLADVFSCVARLGTDGCGYEQHLEGVKRALDGSQSDNANFLRSGAYLAVVILADEDDCSASDTKVFNPDPAQLATLGPEGSFRCTEFGVKCDGKNLTRNAATYSSCSPRGDSYLSDPQHYVDFLLSLKADPKLVLTAVIIGNTTPFSVALDPMNSNPELQHSCDFKINGHDNVADPGVRLAAFATAFGDRGKVLSICQADYSDALKQIAQLIGSFLAVACLNGNIDTTDVNPGAVGLQLDCTVSDVPIAGGAGEQLVPRCPMKDATTPDKSSTPCWWTKIDAAACPTAKSATNTELIIERNGEQAPFGTHVVARCATTK